MINCQCGIQILDERLFPHLSMEMLKLIHKYIKEFIPTTTTKILDQHQQSFSKRVCCRVDSCIWEYKVCIMSK